MKKIIDIDTLKDMIIDEANFWNKSSVWNINDNNYYIYWDNTCIKPGERKLLIEDFNGKITTYEVKISLKKV